MKSILLTSTALIAFAGAALAESHTTGLMADGTTAPSDTTMESLGGASGVTWGADGEFGYNEEVEGGFYFDGGLALTTSAGMNMGLTAGITLDVDLNFNDAEEATLNGFGDGSFDNIGITGSDFVIFVEGQGAALYIGDTETGAATRWAGTTNMEQDGFLEVDDVDDGADNGDFIDGVMRGDVEYGPVAASLSFLLVDDANSDNEDFNGLDGLSLGVEATFGNFVVGMAYQEEINRGLVNFSSVDSNSDGLIGASEAGNDDPGTVDELIGVYAGTTFAGASVKVAYASNQSNDEDSIGVQVDYPFGPVSASVFYSAESATDDNYGVGVSYASGPISAAAYYHDGNDQEIGVEGSYALANGLTMYAGYIQNDDDNDAFEAYAAATYDLGGGASLIAAYGEVGDNYTGANDEIGNTFEVNEGTTVAVSFSF